MLCAADDSGFNQGFEAFSMAVEILDQDAHPADMRPRTPKRGPFMVNRWRARQLGISLEGKGDLIEQVVESALAMPAEAAASP